MRLRSPREVVATTSAFRRAGLLRPLPPVALVRGALSVLRDGVTPAAAIEVAGARFPGAPAVVDDRGSVTYGELARQVGTLAGSLARAGLDHRDRVGVLCRNNVAFVRVTSALSALGADVLLLNAAFAGPQLADVLASERATALVYDGELWPAAKAAPASVPRFLTRRIDGGTGASHADPALDELPPAARSWARRAPRHGTRFVILTSGTTGRPRGAARGMPRSIDPVAGVLDRVPLRVRDVTMISAPLFHGWGFANLGFATALSATVVLQERFDAEAALAAITRHRVRVLVVVPVMLQRILELPAEVRLRHDTSSLQVVFSSGSAMPAGLATRFMDEFGDILYNLYGSTEVALASIATPADLRAAPQCAGRPLLGTTLRIGEDGRILVRNGQLHGNPGAGGFYDTGDLGRFDDAGRLHVEGRADDMIVSGGENVRPQEVEDCLGTHTAVSEAAVVGVPDDKFGQRLRALVVVHDGASVTADELRAHVRDRLARYKVPRDVEFVDAVPRNATGKILHRPPAP